VLITLVSQLLVVIFKYLAGFLLPVEEVLCRLRKLSAAQHESQALQSTSKAGQTTTRYSQYVLDKTTRTFILVAERLVLPHKLVALRLHILDFIVVLGEGAVQL
jgi:hypothetical protein